MQIDFGKINKNRTLKYLMPCLKDHGNVFKAKFNSVFKLAIGIEDELVTNKEIKNRDCLYILIDKDYKPKNTNHFLSWITYQDYYVASYPFDSILNGRMQMVVIEVPGIHKKAYYHFVKSEYSKMYSREKISNLFYDKQDVQNTLLKRTIAKHRFIQQVYDRFDTKITISDLQDTELDFSIDLQEEIFNFNYD